VMPLYEYKCPKCNKRMEVMQKFTDPSPLCMCCDGDPIEMKKQLSLGNFVLKGSGWYKTDYSKKRGA